MSEPTGRGDLEHLDGREGDWRSYGEQVDAELRRWAWALGALAAYAALAGWWLWSLARHPWSPAVIRGLWVGFSALGLFLGINLFVEND